MAQVKIGQYSANFSIGWLGIAGIITSSIMPVPVYAQPIAPASDGTGTIVTPNGQEFLINGGTQAGANLFHSFQQFGLDANQIATFLATPELQNILGRVTGGDPSVINGLLQVTGGTPNLYLLNPAGIIFGNNASLNVPASFTVTTATGIGFGGWGDGGTEGWFSAYGSNNYSTLLGNPTAFRFALPSSPTAPSLINAGALAVNPGHSLNLIGGMVINTGTLSAPGGAITVLAVPNSSLVRLSQPGSLLSLDINPVGAGLAENSSDRSTTSSSNPPLPSPVSLPELLTGSGFSSEATGLAVDADGTVRLTATNTVIPQQAGTTIVSGTIDASSSTVPTPNTPHSTPYVATLGDRVGLLSATINASGLGGGGTVLVGGDYRGGGQVPAALYAYVDAASAIHVDALQTGDGGRAIVWADDTTQFFGSITARGGSISGDGGFVEVSGKDNLVFQGQVDTSAVAGQAGTLLLDPLNLLIGPTTYNGATTSLGTPLGIGDYTWAVNEDSALNGTILTTQIQSLLAFSDVTLEAGNNITWGAGYGLDYDGIPTGRTLTLRAGNTISFSGAIQDGNTTTPNQLNVTFNADRDGNGAGAIVLNGGNISTNGGNIVLSGGIDPTTGFAAGEGTNSRGIFLTNGAILNSGGGSITLRGTSASTGIGNSGIWLQGNTTQIVSGTGAITLVGTNTNPNTIEASVVLSDSQIQSSTGAISLTGTTAGEGRGIAISGTVQSTGGAVSLIGSNTNTGSGSTSGVGVLVFGQVQGNTVNITGTSAGQGVFARGIEIGATGQVALNTGGGQIAFTSSTSSTSSDSASILMLGTLNAGTGSIVFSAQSNPGVRGISMTSGTPQIIAQSIDFTSAQDIVITALTLATSGGPLRLSSTNGSVTTANLSTQGGALTVQASTAITTGTIDTSNSFGNGGNVFLDPSGDIQVTSINAQGGTSGSGGTVDITTDRFFRATGSYIDQNGVLASISTAGGAGGGPITIRHGGGSPSLRTPFVVGASSSNGTVAAITSSAPSATNTIASGSFPQTYTQGNISIITSGSGSATTQDNSPNEYETQQQPTIAIDSGPTFPIFESATQALQRLEQATGKKPAVIYVSFLPASGAPSSTSSVDSSLPDVDDRFSTDFTELLGLGKFDDSDASTPGLTPPGTGSSQAKSLPASAVPDTLWQLNRSGLTQSQRAQPSPSLQPSDSDTLELIMVSPKNKPIRVSLPITRGQVIATALSFRINASDIDSTDYREPAQQLYQWIVAPLEAELKRQKIDTIVFSMDEGLRTLPVAALYDGTNYLVQTYSVAMTPSFNLTDTRYQPIKNLQVLGMGASTFRNWRLGDLTAVPTELQMVQTFWQGRTFLNQEFTLRNLQAERKAIPFGIIHLATHAEFRAEDAYIQLWDTRLQTNQVRQLGWNKPPVELLILSACKTAIGDRGTELGFAGMAVQAGVKSVLASLWSVNDEGTMILMSEFYRQLGRKEVTIKAEALRQAQLAMISGKARPEGGVLTSDRGTVPLPPDLVNRLATSDLSHPYYWSAFTMVGSPW